MEADLTVDGKTGIMGSRIEDHLLPNTVYLTFNRPETNEFHRSIFVTTDNPQQGPADRVVGTLYHAVYEETWRLESRPVRNIGSAKNLILMWKISQVLPHSVPRVAEVLESVPFHVPSGDLSDASKRLRIHVEKGLPLLSGYSCILWTEEALRALEKNGVIQVKMDVGEVMAQARAEAGPEDATLAVHMDFGNTRVVNDT